MRFVYQSDPMYYMPTPSPGTFGVSNPSLRDAPRMYDETAYPLGAVEIGPAGVIQVAYPSIRGWAYAVWLFTNTYYNMGTGGFGSYFEKFDPDTGAYLGRDYMIGILPLPIGYSFAQFEPNTFWMYSLAGGTLTQYDSATYQIINGPLDTAKFTGLTGAHGGDWALMNAFCIDMPNDLLVASITNCVYLPWSCVGIFRWSTGEFLQSIRVAGEPSAVYSIRDGYYISISGSGTSTLFSYPSGNKYGVMNILQKNNANEFTRFGFGYDTFYDRILIVPGSPDNVDGSSTMRISGYFPNAEIDGMAPPLPLNVARKGKITPFVSRLYGNAGEQISGVSGAYSFTPGGDLTFAPSQMLSDSNGYLRTSVTSITPAEETVTCTATQTA